MTCMYPVPAWRAQKVNESGKRGIVFNPREGFSDMALQVPCGKCIGCAADKSLSWSLRLYHESTLHDRSCFVTLTYAEPPACILKKDLQDFFKRLRLSHSFRYFACGEYGETTHRPHYHAVLFGEDFLAGSFPLDDQLYSHEELSSAWGHGFVSIGKVSLASCMYVAGYVNKKLHEKDTFSLMSRRPGLGRDWLLAHVDDLARTGTVTVEGQEFPIPQRYMQWAESELSQVKAERTRRFQEMTPEQRYKRALSLPHKEKNQRAKLGLKSETI